MSDTLISDWSMYQSRFTGAGNKVSELYYPAKWIVDIGFSMVKASGIAGVLLRVGIGYLKDPCFSRYLEGVKGVGLPWGLYHAYMPSLDAALQAQKARSFCLETPPLGVYGDLEAGNANFPATNIYFQAMDTRFQLQTGIYSGGPYMNGHFTVAQQKQWVGRRTWWAGYPNFILPNGWIGVVPTYYLHQFADNYQLAGLKRPSDMSRLNPNLPVPPTVTHVNSIRAHSMAILGLAA